MDFYSKIINKNTKINLDIKNSVSSVILNSNFISILLEKINIDLTKIYEVIKIKLQYKSKIDSIANVENI